ncbi:ATP-dependent RecD-like DNA helicase [Candidatus Dependentiae bacterium]
MSQLEELTGIVEKLIFQSDENGYSVFMLQLRGNNTVTVTGHIPTIQPGQQVTVSGFWTMHSKFGKQFEAKNCQSCLPNSILGLKKYLGSGLIKGIGPVYAEKLVNKFGTEVLEIIENFPSKLGEISGIGPKRIEKITNAWQDQKEISKVMIFLQEKGVSTVYATKIYKTYGQEAISVINENPYRLADDIWGIGFKKADQIAQNLGFEKNSLKRITSGILFVVSQELSNGHLYVELEELKEKTVTILELDLEPDTGSVISNAKEKIKAKIKMAFHNLYDSGKIKLVSHEDKHFVTLSQYYFSEKGVANKVLKLSERQVKYNFDITEVYNKIRVVKNKNDIELNGDQQSGILACLQHKVTVITGGPGTGKTTLIKKLLEVLDEHNLSYKLAAPTGRAAKRMFEGTGRHASTIHRLLEFDFSTMGFAHNEQNALSVDFLIIDEASMIDVFLAHALLKALPLDVHIVFIGDIYQLPSVGAGNFLKDLISSGKAASVCLKEIFRQAQDSMIVVNAHRINSGEFPLSYMPEGRRDFIFIKENEPENVPLHLKTIYKKALFKFGIRAKDSIVLVPMHRGSVGTQKLNYDLQTILNPSEDVKKLSHSGNNYKIGDPVMQLRNNYDKHVFNGDIGTIVDIKLEDRELLVDFDGRTVEYDYSDLNEIVLAYSISIHKSQGSEYSAAIIPIFTQHFTLLQRNLIYTAITRAKKLCIFIGQPKAIAMAIKNNKSLVRKTFLKEYLTTDLQCR